MALTGRAEGPALGPPTPLVGRLAAVAGALARQSSRLGHRLDVDPLGLLSERAAIAGLSRQGRTSCGDACRLLPTTDGWLAVSLARDDDVELVPAWLGRGALAPADDPWEVVAAGVARRPTSALAEGAALLG